MHLCIYLLKLDAVYVVSVCHQQLVDYNQEAHIRAYHIRNLIKTCDSHYNNQKL